MKVVVIEGKEEDCEVEEEETDLEVERKSKLRMKNDIPQNKNPPSKIYVTPQKYPRIFIIVLLYVKCINRAKWGFSRN